MPRQILFLLILVVLTLFWGGILRRRSNDIAGHFGAIYWPLWACVSIGPVTWIVGLIAQTGKIPGNAHMILMNSFWTFGLGIIFGLTAQDSMRTEKSTGNKT